MTQIGYSLAVMVGRMAAAFRNPNYVRASPSSSVWRPAVALTLAAPTAPSVSIAVIINGKRPEIPKNLKITIGSL